MQKKDRDGNEDPPQGRISFLHWLKKLFSKKSAAKHKVNYSKELEIWLNEAKMTKAEREICYNLLAIRDLTVEDIMIPRAEISALAFKTPLKELLKAFKDTRHSALLVYLGDLDDILGMIHLKDLLEYALDPKDVSLKSFIRKVLFVSPAMRALDLLYRMRSTGIHFAVVVDEYGGTDGLVTLDDIIEHIIGDIEDETEMDDEPELIGQEDGSYIADARVFLDDLEETLGCQFSDEEHEEADTIGGLIFALLGRIPVRGEIVKHDLGLEFHILDADPRRIKKVHIYLKRQMNE